MCNKNINNKIKNLSLLGFVNRSLDLNLINHILLKSISTNPTFVLNFADSFSLV